MPGKPKKARRMGKRILRLVRPQYTLCYGMRMDPGTAPEQTHPHVRVTLPDGTEERMALHVINGSMKEIEAAFRQSIEAFFEMCRETEV